MDIRLRDKLANWEDLLVEDLGCDGDSVDSFRQLVTLYGDRGLMEGTRALAHVLKDREKPHAWWQTEAQRNSLWLRTAVEESLDALNKPDIWNSGGPLAEIHGRQRGLKGGKGGGKGAWPAWAWCRWHHGLR